MKKLLFTTLIVTSSFLQASLYPAHSNPFPASPRLAQKDINDDGTLTPQGVQQAAKSITVRITSENNGGSGVIIAKKGDNYLILTNAHVVRQAGKIAIQAPDGQKYQAKSIDGGFNTKYDLALLQFTSKTKYTLAKLEDRTRSTIEPTRKIYSSGFPFDSKDIRITSGEVSQLTDIPFDDGTQIGYVTNKGEKGIRQGMSGGAIFDVQGNFLGINTVGIAPILPNYTYNDGSKPSSKLAAQYTRANWGIPVYNFLTHVKADILYGYDNLPKVEHQVSPTGYMAKLNDKARKMTVRIENSDGNGSGVIVAKEGNSYYVLTAKHVVQDEKRNTHQKFADGQIITYDQDTHPITSTVVAEGVDLAVIKFTSSSNYPLAKLGGYSTKDDDLAFVGGFPGRDRIKSPLWQWQLNPGFMFSKERGRIKTQDNQSFAPDGGYDLIYSSISYGGMSGGPVFDTNGNVIGIHGKAEVTDGTMLGQSLGISIQTFTGLVNTKQLQIAPKLLTIAPNHPSNLSSVDRQNVMATMENIPKPEEREQDGKRWLAYGNQLYRTRQYDKSIAAFDRAIAKGEKISGYYGKYLSLAGGKRFKEAEIAIAQAISAISERKEDPGIYYYFWYKQAGILRKLYKYDEALKSIETAIIKRPDDLNLRYEKAIILFQQRKYLEANTVLDYLTSVGKEWYFYSISSMNKSFRGDNKGAIADANKLVKLNPSFENAYGTRALLKSRIGDNKGAIEDAEIAVRLNPNSDWAYHTRSIVKRDIGDNRGAMKDVDRAIQLDPKEDSNYETRATLKQNLEDNKGAISDLDRAIEINSSSFTSYYARGISKSELGDYKGAIKDYNKGIELNPNFEVIYTGRGFAKSQLSDNKGAMEDAERAIKINPKNPQTYSFRAVIESSLGKKKEALIDYDTAIALMPKSRYIQWTTDSEFNILHSNLYRGRGSIRSALGNKKGGIEDESRAIELNPKNSLAYNFRGIIKSELGDYKGAIQDFTKAIELDPKFGTTYFQRGDAKLKIGDNRGAIIDFTKAIELDPKNIKNENDGTYTVRAFAKLNMGDKQGAIDDLSKAIELDPKNALFPFLRGSVKSKLGDNRGAIDDYTQAIKLNPKYANAYSNRGSIKLSKLGDYKGAIYDYTEAIKFDPQKDYNYALRGVAKSELGDKQGAIDDYTQAIKIDPKYAEAYSNRGNAKLALGDKQGAISDYNKAIELNPKNENVYLSRGVAKFELGDNTGAITDTNTALKLNPQNASSYANRGAFKIIDGKEKEALPDLEQAIKLDPKMSYAYAGRGIVKETFGDKQGAILDYKQALKLNPQLLNEWKKQAAFIQKYNTASYQKYQLMIQKLEAGIRAN